MLERTKKHHIEQNIVGPAENWPKVESILKEFGFSIQTEGSIPWRDAFPKEFTDNESGTALRGARNKEGLTQMQLSEKTGIPQRHISEMERGKRPIGRKNAKLFANALNINYRIFL